MEPTVASIQPAEEKGNPAFHFFLYLVSFLALIFVSFGLGNILFQIVNKLFSEQDRMTEYFNDFDQGGIRFGIAALIIAVPTYLWVTFVIQKKIGAGEISEKSKVRRWLTYIVLFFAAATVIGDLITLLTNFLSGDIATRFLLKTLIIFVIAGSIFSYYFWEIRRKNLEGQRFLENRIAFAGVVVCTIAALVTGFFFIDSPRVARDKRLDEQTVSALSSLDYDVQLYYDNVKKLPDSIDIFRDKQSTYFQSGLELNPSITYEKRSEMKYSICAEFRVDNQQEIVGKYDSQWGHAAGRVCFERQATEGNSDIIKLPNPTP
ncbi:hypothetical protein EPO05_04255 [Patescibacteria group bacterium]|nr:MAG: hypothetical protein EPO05_04255 [Patescibacteria group bacterium]